MPRGSSPPRKKMRAQSPRGSKVVILDWDGTIVHLGIQSAPDNGAACARQLGSRSAEYRRSVNMVLEAAKRVGRVYIVTAADQGWINTVGRCYAPGVPIISARDLHGHTGREAWQWKVPEFKKLARNASQLIVIGDSAESEIRAGIAVSQELGIPLKTLHLNPAPVTIDDLLHRAHPKIVRFLNSV